MTVVRGSRCEARHACVGGLSAAAVMRGRRPLFCLPPRNLMLMRSMEETQAEPAWSEVPWSKVPFSAHPLPHEPPGAERGALAAWMARKGRGGALWCLPKVADPPVTSHQHTFANCAGRARRGGRRRVRLGYGRARGGSVARAGAALRQARGGARGSAGEAARGRGEVCHTGLARALD